MPNTKCHIYEICTVTALILTYLINFTHGYNIPEMAYCI